MSGIPAIGDVVREWRGYLQISLTEFSRRTKLSKGYISELEHNKIDNPKADKRKRLAAALGITERDILSRLMPEEVRGFAQDKDAGPKEKQDQKIVAYGRALKSGTQTISAPMPTASSPALALPDSLTPLLYETFDQIEVRIKSRDLSEEQMKRLAAGLLDSTNLLLEVIKPNTRSHRRTRR